MSDNDEDPQEVDPALVRYLRLLVTVLSITMIAGFLVLIALFVTRLRAPPPPMLPDAIVLPEGAEAETFTMGAGWFAVVTKDQRILIFDSASGDLRQSITLDE